MHDIAPWSSFVRMHGDRGVLQPRCAGTADLRASRSGCVATDLQRPSRTDGRVEPPRSSRRERRPTLPSVIDQHAPIDESDVQLPAPRVRVLGPLRVVGPDGPLRLGGPKERLVLGVLVARHGTTVPIGTLAEALWGDQPPRSAERTI